MIAVCLFGGWFVVCGLVGWVCFVVCGCVVCCWFVVGCWVVAGGLPGGEFVAGGWIFCELCEVWGKVVVC